MSSSQTYIILLLTLIFQLKNIAAVSCDSLNITSVIQNNTLIIHFTSNYLLKLNRQIQCSSESSWVPIHGCTHICTGLEYGQQYTTSIEMQDDNGNSTNCLIESITELQPPSLAYLNVTGDKVRLTVTPPIGSFDSFIMKCPNNETYTENSNQTITVNCSFIPNLPLMSFVLESFKSGFQSATRHITQEIPLPVPFAYNLDSFLLNVSAEAPPFLNLNSTYEFRLIFYHKDNQNIFYERAKVIDRNPRLNSSFAYGIIPNLLHTIIFTHTVNSIGYAQNNGTLMPVSNTSYPLNVTNVRVREEFNNIIVTWIDPHSSDDPIEFIILCNSNASATKSVHRNTTYICQQMTFNETDVISVQTHVAIPGYRHDSIGVSQIDVQGTPDIPLFEVKNHTENSITIRWDANSIALKSNSFEYRIQCGSNNTFISIDIQTSEYQCQLLESGSLYIITMLVSNTDNTIQRSKSVYANTLLHQIQYKNHFYSPDLNGTCSIIIEWTRPFGNFDAVHMDCPSSSMTYEYGQLMPIMYTKCLITSGTQLNVTFFTAKNGYERAIFQFTDTSPPPTAATSQPSTTSSTTTTPASDQKYIESTRWRIAAIIGFIVAGFLFLVNIALTIFLIHFCLRNRQSHR